MCVCADVKDAHESNDSDDIAAHTRSIEFPVAKIGSQAAAHIRLGDGGTAFWFHSRLADRVALVLASSVFILLILAAFNTSDQYLTTPMATWSTTLAPLLLTLGGSLLHYLNRAGRPSSRIDWTPETITVTREGQKHGELTWNPNDGSVVIEGDELVFTTAESSMRTPAPPANARQRLLRALRTPAREAEPLKWKTSFDKQSLTLPGRIGPRGVERVSTMRDAVRLGAFGIATQWIVFLASYAVNPDFLHAAMVAVAAAAGMAGVFGGMVFVGWLRGNQLTRRLTYEVSNTHLEIRTTDKKQTVHRWLWDDIQAIEGHVDWLCIVAGDERVTIDLSPIGAGMGSRLIHDLQQRWQQSRATPDEREATLHAQSILAGVTERS